MKQTELFLYDKVVNIDKDILQFKNREIKAKEIFNIIEMLSSLRNTLTDFILIIF